MAKRKISVKTTPGINAPVEHVLRLEDLLGRPVDLVTDKALRPELRARVEREAVHV